MCIRDSFTPAPVDHVAVEWPRLYPPLKNIILLIPYSNPIRPIGGPSFGLLIDEEPRR